MFKKFIEHPVLSTVISIVVVLLGILGLIKLPIAQYPDITPPTVRVSANYGGANAEVVMNSVIIPLEEKINGVEGMTYMTSSASNDGSANINVYFNVGTDPDQAAVNVQNRVATATRLLPAEVTQAGVTVRKRQNSTLLMTGLYTNNPAYDESFLQNYANINLVPQLQRVEGVGDASAFGSKIYAMRIWLKPDIMMNYGLTPGDITSALNEQNIEAAPGKFGEQGNQSFQYVIRYTGKLKTVQEFENIVVRAGSNGQLLRLRDIARVELGAQSYQSRLWINGMSGTNIAVNQTAGSNARDVINGCKEQIKEASKSFPKDIHYTNLVDANRFLDVSIHKVMMTFIEAFILVFLVVFLFLKDFRSSLIPAISVPVAIIGTFFFLYLFHFSINLLTLFALVLAIGIVVDDAIVVVEAVHAKLDQGYTSAKQASIDAMSEITSAIIAITLVMASVFVPVTFVTGSSGVFYRQFGLTLAVAILLSAVNALTLSPALAALFLKPKDEEKKHKKYTQKFMDAFEAGYQATSKKYTDIVSFLSERKKLVIGLVLVFACGFLLLIKHTPTGFVPDEDMGTIYVNISLPPASSLERTSIVAAQVDSIARSLPEVGDVMRMIGQNTTDGNGSSYAQIILQLKDWKERGDVTNTEVIAKIMKGTSTIRNAKIIPLSMPTISGFGSTSGFSFELQDKGGHTTKEFYKVSQDFLKALEERPEIQYASTPFNPNFPQYLLSLNIPKIKEAGMSINGVMDAMQIYYGGYYASNFNQFGKQFRVMVQADTSYRANIDGLSKIYIRGDNNQMAPITEFVTMTPTYGPESLSRFNLYSSMTIKGSPGDGYSSGEALAAIQEVADQNLPKGYGYEFSGMSREEQNSSSQMVYVLMLSLIFVYLLLCALYDSYLLPFAVIFSLPVGLCGTFIFAKIFNIDNNIYMQISMIMLIGLLAKNAILIVHFAKARREKGMSVLQAAIEGAKARLRPILMTSLAFIFGILPLMFATGAGANGNRSIGVSAVGGMVFGLLFGILIIPGLYVIFQGIGERFSKKKKPLEYLKQTILPILVLSILTSCGVITKTYKQPESTVTDNLYRSSNSLDSVSLADKPWQELFSDPLLRKLIQEGLNQNLSLKSAAERMNAAQATLNQQKLALLPSVNGSADVSRKKPYSTLWEAGLGASWELDIWGKLTSSKKAALASYLQTDAARRAIQTALISNIAKNYYHLLALDEQLAITNQTVHIREMDVESMKLLKESAIVNGASVVQSQANLYSAEVSIPDLQQSIRETENALCTLLGRTPGNIERGTLAQQLPQTDLKLGVSSRLLENRPDIQEAELALREAFENGNAAKADLYPSIKITANGGLSSLNLSDFLDKSLFYNLMGGLTQPIFNNGQVRANYKIAKSRQQQAYNSFRESLLNAGEEVSNALYAYEMAVAKEVSRDKQLKALEKSVDFTKELLKYSSATNYTDVLTSEQSLLSAQLASVNDQVQKLQAVVELYRALGGGWK